MQLNCLVSAHLVIALRGGAYNFLLHLKSPRFFQSTRIWEHVTFCSVPFRQKVLRRAPRPLRRSLRRPRQRPHQRSLRPMHRPMRRPMHRQRILRRAQRSPPWKQRSTFIPCKPSEAVDVRTNSLDYTTPIMPVVIIHLKSTKCVTTGETKTAVSVISSYVTQVPRCFPRIPHLSPMASVRGR